MAPRDRDSQELERESQRFRVGFGVSCLTGAPEGLWLDLGCGRGSGYQTKLVKSSFVGLDLSLSELLKARRDHPQWRFVCGAVEALPFKAEAFDGVAALALLGAVPLRAQAEVLAGIARVLRRNGRLLVLVSAKGLLWELSGHTFLYPRAWRHFEPKTLISSLAAAGLKVKWVRRRAGVRSLVSDIVVPRMVGFLSRLSPSLRRGLSALLRALVAWQEVEYAEERSTGRYLYLLAERTLASSGSVGAGATERCSSDSAE